jgi:hypothetical protein
MPVNTRRHTRYDHRYQIDNSSVPGERRISDIFGARTFLSAWGFILAKKADKNVRAPKHSFNESLEKLRCLT